MAIFKKKQTRVYIPNKINATTRLSSLYGDDANIRYLEDRINNMRNVDAYTKQESDNRFARLSENNTFTNNQSIKGGSAFVEFKGTDNNRKGYVGKPSSTSNDIELKAETNSLTVSAKHHVIIKPGSNYQARYEKTPTEGVEIANKAYVDTKTAANKTILDQHENRITENRNKIGENKNNIDTIIQTFDRVPKLDRRNTFTEDNNFLGTVTGSRIEGNTVNCSSLVVENVDNSNDKSGVNVKYLNDKLKQYQPTANVALTNKENIFREIQTVKANLDIQNPSAGDYSDLNFYKSDGRTKYGQIGLEKTDNQDFLISSKQRDLLLSAQRRVKSFVDMDMSGRRILNVSNPGADTDAATKQYVDDIAIVKKGYKNVSMKFSKVHIASGVFMYGSYGTVLEYMTLSDLKPNQRYEMVIRMRRIDGSRINLFLKAMEIISDTHGKVSILPYYFNDTEVVFIWNKDLKPGGSGDTGLKNCEIGYVLIPIK